MTINQQQVQLSIQERTSLMAFKMTFSSSLAGLSSNALVTSGVYPVAFGTDEVMLRKLLARRRLLSDEEVTSRRFDTAVTGDINKSI